jgi:hypothetical protein
VRIRVFPARKGSLTAMARAMARVKGWVFRTPAVGRSGFCSAQLSSVQVSSVQVRSGQFSSVQFSSVFRQRSGSLVSCILYPISCIHGYTRRREERNSYT